MSQRQIPIKYNVSKLNYKIITSPKYFNATNNICEICKQSLYDKKVVIVGVCHHCFHEECIQKLDKKSCPIDGTVWKDESIINFNPQTNPDKKAKIPNIQTSNPTTQQSQTQNPTHVPSKVTATGNGGNSKKNIATKELTPDEIVELLCN